MALLLVTAAGIQAYPIFRKEEDVGQRVGRECDAIVQAAAEVAPGTMREDIAILGPAATLAQHPSLTSTRRP